MKTTVIYHRADFDGIFCREIAKKFLPDAELIGWHYGDPIPNIPRHEDDGGVRLYMLDISVDGLMDYPGLIWIDHHKSAIEKFSKDIPGYRIDGVAACRLLWQWCLGPDERLPLLPQKEAFVDRLVSEPLAVRLAGEYDIWDKRDPRAELFQHGLRSQPLDANVWRWLLGTDCHESMMTSTVEALLKQGEAIQYSSTQNNAAIIKDIGFDLEWEGLKFLACNHARYNSHLFAAGLKPEHDACFGFKYLPCGDWEVSLYHAPGKEHHDLSAIAKAHGGGGHKGACGFRLKKLPFVP